MEENKLEAPPLMTPLLMETKINNEVAESKLSVADLENRALKLVKNEDNLQEMASLLKDLNKLRKVAIKAHKTVKKPFQQAVRYCDAGKKLVFTNIDRIRDMVKPDYDRILADVDARKRAALKKEAEDEAIRKGIEETGALFTKKIAEATTRKELSNVERLINLEKSSSRSKKYGDFHAFAVKRYDEMLKPIINKKKIKLDKLVALHGELEEAESDNDVEDVDKLKNTIEIVSQEVRQSQSELEDLLLNQEFFPVIEAQEVLPAFRTKRTDISFELIDVEVALENAPELLTIELNNKALREIAAEMKENGDFEGKDFVIVDGIKFIVTRLREAL